MILTITIMAIIIAVFTIFNFFVLLASFSRLNEAVELSKVNRNIGSGI